MSIKFIKITFVTVSYIIITILLYIININAIYIILIKYIINVNLINTSRKWRSLFSDWMWLPLFHTLTSKIQWLEVNDFQQKKINGRTDLGDTLGSGGGVVEAARAWVRCAWAKFKELSPILTVHRIVSKEGSIVLVSRVFLIYGTETWAIKADDLKNFGKEMDVWGVLER